MAKCKITFSKIYHINLGISQEKKANKLIVAAVSILKGKYKFRIIKANLDGYFNTNKIIFECQECDKEDIFSDFKRMLAGWIERQKLFCYQEKENPWQQIII